MLKRLGIESWLQLVITVCVVSLVFHLSDASGHDHDSLRDRFSTKRPGNLARLSWIAGIADDAGADFGFSNSGLSFRSVFHFLQARIFHRCASEPRSLQPVSIGAMERNFIGGAGCGESSSSSTGPDPWPSAGRRLRCLQSGQEAGFPGKFGWWLGLAWSFWPSYPARI